ncbi:MAG: F0F1 ATP synthase subunit delta [Actinomycetota bacterium]|nr:F0F1 ATP synthase subunit delta [Actinomycetota bacterium]
MLGASRSSLAQARTRLAELPGQGADLEALSVDLFAVAELLVRELPLRRALADPSTEGAAKAALLRSLLGERISAPALEFLTELVGSRWSRPSDLVDAVETLAVIASFEQALVDGTLDDVEDGLFRFGRILERETALREALGDPGQPVERKRALLEQLLAGKVGPVAQRVIGAALVSVRRRSVGEAIDSFAQLAAELRERLNARVTLAVEPSAEQLDRMAQTLSRVYGKPMGLRVEVDPAILGGAVVRVGDEVLEASVARRLDIARRGLTQHL